MGKDAQGHVEWDRTAKSQSSWDRTQKCRMMSSVEYNVKHDTVVALEFRHTSDSHIADFTNLWNFWSIRNSRNYWQQLAHLSSMETKAQEKLRIEPEWIPYSVTPNLKCFLHLRPNIYQTSSFFRPPLTWGCPNIVYATQYVGLFFLFSMISAPTKHFHTYHPI